MKLLSLSTGILASIFGLLSCQKSADDNLPENAPAALQSIIQAPDGEKFLLTRFEEKWENISGYDAVWEYQYTPKGVLTELREYDEDNEHIGTAKVTYEQNKVELVLTYKEDNTWKETHTFNLLPSGWPKSMDEIETAGSRIVQTIQEEYTLNADDYITEVNATYIHPSDDPQHPISRLQQLSRYFYEDGNLVKVEKYEDGSPTPLSVMMFEYDKNKPNLLKIVADEGYGTELHLNKPSRNLLVKVERWGFFNGNQNLQRSSVLTNTYQMNSHGLPAEMISTQAYDLYNIPSDKRTTKFTYTKL
ncbi:hypothetical protein [Pseudoflavitalea rhizosphaerae]|uniref:hypothetical protein n=1 Tax=Pseudoflavitalea rhizosphaerae TaxID=1884793 RepID=UPI000F8CCB6A|nr:hypothetical protein [Pseudoflavitalea rhizosphaerae]